MTKLRMPTYTSSMVYEPTEGFGIKRHNGQILEDDTEKVCAPISDYEQYRCPQNVEKRNGKRERKDRLLTLPEDV